MLPLYPVSINLLWVRQLLLALVNLKIGLSDEDCGGFGKWQQSLSWEGLQPEGRERNCSAALLSCARLCILCSWAKMLFAKDLTTSKSPLWERAERRWGMTPVSGCLAATWAVWCRLPSSAECRLLALALQDRPIWRPLQSHAGLHQSAFLQSGRCLAQFVFAVCLHTISHTFSCFSLLTVPGNHFGVTYTCWPGS